MRAGLLLGELEPTMSMSRRGFLTAAAGLAAAPVLVSGVFARGATGRGPARAEETYFRWVEAGPEARVAFGEGGNALVLSGGGDMLLVDCKLAGFGAVLRREARLGAGRLVAVVNTHHHADHTGGNSAFADIPDVLVSHRNTPGRVSAQAERYVQQIRGVVGQLARSRQGAAQGLLEEVKALADAPPPVEAYVPTRVFDDVLELRVGPHAVRLVHFGPGHTDNDAVVHVPGLNLVHTGDLVFHRCHPFIDLQAGATTVGWLGVLRRVLELCDGETVVVPGHGEVTTAEGIRGQIAYLERVRDEVSSAIAAGRSREEIERIVIPEFAEFELPQLRARALGSVYEELSAGE